MAAREPEGNRIEAEMSEVCGVVNAASGRLVRLVGELLECGSWEVAGIHSPEQWVSWKCGLSSRRAYRLVAMAKRMGELPATAAALDAGELSEDQVAVICRSAPPTVDAEVVEIARHCTVGLLSRVLGRYVFESSGDEPGEEAGPEVPGAEVPGAEVPGAEVPGAEVPGAEVPGAEVPGAEVAGTGASAPVEVRRVSFGFTDSGAWRLSAVLAADEGALVERALEEARDLLFRSGERDEGPRADPADVSWADALVSVADKSLGADPRAHRDRHLVLLHVRADGGGHLHLGPGVPEGLRRYLSCDSRVRATIETETKALSVGRAIRVVPERTRIAIEDRDGGCRVPGCERSRWLHIHHIRPWDDGGATDTPNLVALCQHHHRLHHRGRLGIEGNADETDGMVFTDDRGRRLEPCGHPTPPGDRSPPPGNWVPPSGEHLDPWAIYFNEAATPALVAPP